MGKLTDFSLTMFLHKTPLAITRLSPRCAIPSWLDWSTPFTMVARTKKELSIVCTSSLVPLNIQNAQVEKDFFALEVLGPIPFHVTGVLSRISTVLAKTQIPVFVISTFDTDYILLRTTQVKRACIVLENIATVQSISL